MITRRTFMWRSGGLVAGIAVGTTTLSSAAKPRELGIVSVLWSGDENTE